MTTPPRYFADLSKDTVSSFTTLCIGVKKSFAMWERLRIAVMVEMTGAKSLAIPTARYVVPGDGGLEDSWMAATGYPRRSAYTTP